MRGAFAALKDDNEKQITAFPLAEALAAGAGDYGDAHGVEFGAGLRGLG
jgi:hypothetical protein